MLINNIAYWRSTRMQGKGISKAHLARRLGVSRSFVSKLENGASHPSAEMMLKIAAYFQEPVEAIFKFEGNGESHAVAHCGLSIPSSQFSKNSSCLSSGNENNKGQIVGKSNGEGSGVPVAQ